MDPLTTDIEMDKHLAKDTGSRQPTDAFTPRVSHWAGITFTCYRCGADAERVPVFYPPTHSDRR